MDVEKLRIDRSTSESRPRARKRRWLGPLLTVVFVLLVLWLFQAQLSGFIDAWRLPEVRTQRVILRSGAAAATASGTSANGYIVARTRAALSADTPGRIVEMNVEEGSVVKKGQVVARLYSDEYRAALQHADADLALARTTLERVKLEVGSAEKEVDHSKSAEKAAQADLDQANSNLALAETQFKRAQDLVDQGVDTAEKRDLARRELDSAKSRVPWAKANLETAQAATAQSDQRLMVVAGRGQGGRGPHRAGADGARPGPGDTRQDRGARALRRHRRAEGRRGGRGRLAQRRRAARTRAARW